MPLPGGPAAKVGVRYERGWTVLQMLRVLEGTAERLRIEFPGAAGEGAEFRLDTPEGSSGTRPSGSVHLISGRSRRWRRRGFFAILSRG